MNQGLFQLDFPQPSAHDDGSIAEQSLDSVLLKLCDHIIDIGTRREKFATADYTPGKSPSLAMLFAATVIGSPSVQSVLPSRQLLDR